MNKKQDQKQEIKDQGMKLDIRVYPIDEPKNNTLAFASATVNDMLAIHGIRVMDSKNGKFAAMPSMKDAKTGEYRDVCHPITSDLRKQLNAAILTAYDEALTKGAQEKASVKEQIKGGEKAGTEKAVPDKEKTANKSGPEL